MAGTPRITLEQWRALQAVVEEGGYAQAAEALHKSQSTVTYAVQQIQKLLDVQVFEIRGRKAVLTDGGRCSTGARARCSRKRRSSSAARRKWRRTGNRDPHRGRDRLSHVAAARGARGIRARSAGDAHRALRDRDVGHRRAARRGQGGHRDWRAANERRGQGTRSHAHRPGGEPIASVAPAEAPAHGARPQA